MNREKASIYQEAEKIFRQILPNYGMNQREEQIWFCHAALEAMCDGKTILCDAGTGIGKTYAYLIAGILFDQYRQRNGMSAKPMVLSTASIALQGAIHSEYIPFLSRVLLAEEVLKRPIHSVIRKGKGHYVCPKRLRQRLERIDREKKNQKNLSALLALQKELDMDGVRGLSGYDRRQVQVPRTCHCSEEGCRYKEFVEESNSSQYLFQICNHNMLLADALHRAYQMRPLFPDYSAAVLDEAHKLPEAAGQMFGKTLSLEEMLSLVKGLREERFVLAAQKAQDAFAPIRAALEKQKEELCSKKGIRALKRAQQILTSIQKTIAPELPRPLCSELRRIIGALSLFTDQENDVILYVGLDDRQRPILCAQAANTAQQMERVIWSMPVPMVLTSGTLAVGEDFSYFKKQIGLPKRLQSREAVFASPFDYERNCLLYLPRSATRYTEKDTTGYYAKTARTIAELLKASGGHALVLFNSYSAMAAVRERLKEYHLQQPIYVMSRSDTHTVSQFKRSGNGILLATGTAWEGMDFPGDTVSMLIIPRLPFAAPDALSEKKKKECGSLRAFIRQIAVPEMQRKLRQGFGRAIRLETDTCVIAILDERALEKGRYRDDVLQALPPVKITGDMKEVRRFFAEKKMLDYWKGDSKNERNH